jgi:hypothetical protein
VLNNVRRVGMRLVRLFSLETYIPLPFPIYLHLQSQWPWMVHLFRPRVELLLHGLPPLLDLRILDLSLLSMASFWCVLVHIEIPAPDAGKVNATGNVRISGFISKVRGRNLVLIKILQYS